MESKPFSKKEEPPPKRGLAASFRVPVRLVVVAIAPALVVKGKLADFVVAGTVKVEDVCLVVTGKLLEGFGLAGRVFRAFFAVPAV